MTHMFVVFLRHFKALAILGCPRVWRIAPSPLWSFASPPLHPQSRPPQQPGGTAKLGWKRSIRKWDSLRWVWCGKICVLDCFGLFRIVLDTASEYILIVTGWCIELLSAEYLIRFFRFQRTAAPKKPHWNTALNNLSLRKPPVPIQSLGKKWR